MAQAHTDAEMLLATQIAYLNVEEYSGGYMTVREILDRIESRYEGQENLAPLQKSQLETVQNIRTMIEENGLDYCGEWRIVQCCNKNSETGFYAVTIDTGYNDAIIGFRGSETWDDSSQLINDWGRADLGLLNSYQTAQQRDAEDYIREFERKFGSRYDRVSTTGHSLGGNLAEHAAITAPDSFKKKLDRATSWDGPGFSDEYIRYHTLNGDIKSVSDKIDHYRWSFVSSLLNPIPGTHTICIDTKGEPEDPAERDKKMFGLEQWRLWRHSPMNVNLRGGDVIEIPYEEADLYFRVFGPISRVLENSSPVKNILYSIPMIGPAIFVIERANSIISLKRLVINEIRQFAEDFVNKFSEEVKRITDTIRQRYRQSRVSGVYSTDTSVIRSVSGEFDRYAGQMQQIQDEVKRIAGALPYDSVSGNYYRVKLYSIAGSIGSDAKKARKCAAAAQTAAESFEWAEANVAGKFM